MTKYHVALSFAGEDRAYVEQVATALKSEGVDVFYDLYEEAELWGKDLYEHLSNIYQKMAMFTVMFVSEPYRQKVWTNHERKSAQARAFSESREYILPAIFDESVEIPGLLKTTGHVLLKTKTPDQLSRLIVKKLEKSGVNLRARFSYAENVKSDADFPVSKAGVVGEIVKSLRVYTWSVQNPAVQKLLELDWSSITSDQAFVLGRNLYQCACGGERKAESVLASLRKEIASVDDDRAIDLVNGMFFEVYFDSNGEFRGRIPKARCLDKLLALQSVKKFEDSIIFIRRALEPYRSSLIFRPNTTPEIVTVNIKLKKSDPPIVKNMSISDRSLLSSNPSAEDLDTRLWRISYQSFTVSELHHQISVGWGIPTEQLKIDGGDSLVPTTKLRLPEGTSIIWPVPA